jgi:NDP-sugar pyrophosphorylase family protein
MMKEEGTFSIIDSYMRLAAQDEKILGFRADEYYWRDLGRIESVAAAERDLREGVFLMRGDQNQDPDRKLEPQRAQRTRAENAE